MSHTTVAGVLHFPILCPQLHKNKTCSAHQIQKNYRIIPGISEEPHVIKNILLSRYLKQAVYLYSRYHEDTNIPGVICLLWMCTPNVCQPFFSVLLSGLSSQCAQLKEKQFTVHTKISWKRTYLPSHSENCNTLFTDSQDPAPPQILFYHNKLQGAGGTLFSTKCFSDLTTTLSLQMTGNLCVNQEVTWT